MIGRRTASRACVLAGFVAAVVLPAVAFFHDRKGVSFLDGVHGRALLRVFFPLVGLYAFTFVTAQVLIATNLYWLTTLARHHSLPPRPRHIRVVVRHSASAVHTHRVRRCDVLFLQRVPAIWRGRLDDPRSCRPDDLALTVSTAALAWSGRRVAWWRSVHRLNYLVFGLVWLHSWFT